MQYFADAWKYAMAIIPAVHDISWLHYHGATIVSGWLIVLT